MNTHKHSLLRGLLPLCALALLLVGCASTTGGQPTTTTLLPTATPTAGTLPTFSDWRVAYIARDGTLHAISQNGATDSRAGDGGGALPLMERLDYHIFTAGVSPDGHFFAYGYDQTYIINLATRDKPTLSVAAVSGIPDALFWSPDSKRLAVDINGQGWSTVDVATDQATPVPGAVAAQAQMLGWIDATHLLGLTGNDVNSTRETLLSLDVSSGARRTIATVATGSLSSPIFVLSPDGRQVLLYNVIGGEGVTIPYTPFVEVIDTATGQKHQLPRLTQLTSAGLGPIAWKPGTEIAAASVEAQSGLQTWLLDLAHDSATQLPGSQYPLGWAPDTGALILSDSLETQTGTLHMISIMPSLSAAPNVLVQAAYSLPFVGFVRTA